MREESRYLQQHAQARAAIKEIIEMPNIQIDRVIRSAQANQGKLSNALAKELPALTEAGRWEAIVEAIGVAFDDTLLEPSDGRAADQGCLKVWIS